MLGSIKPDEPTQYALDVLSGVEVAGPYVRMAAQRHLDDWRRNGGEIWWDPDEYDRVVNRFFQKRLKLSEGQFEGEPFRLHPSQKFIIGSIFAWRRRDPDVSDRTRWPRRYRRAYIEAGKGNGKSPVAGGIGLFGMMYDNEPGAQIYSAGADRNQADILFQDAVKMAQAVPKVWADITSSGNAKIWNLAALGPRQKGSFFRPLARTAGKSGSGPRPHMALCDELHEHPDRKVLDILEAGFKFRRNPLLLMITNSGTDRKSVCWEERTHAVSILKGERADDSTFAYVCALDDGDDPLEDPSCWKKANPLLGITITEDYLAGVVESAKAIPGKRNTTLRLHFCCWTDSDVAWIRQAVWEKCEDPNMRIEDFEGITCRGGLDLSSRKDLTAKALVFDDGYVPDPENEERMLPKFAAFVHGYTPKATLAARVKDDRTPYDEWCDDGFITATPGPTVRYPFIISDLEKDSQRFELEAVAYDNYLWSRFQDDMNDMGVDLPTLEHPQGFSKRSTTELWMPDSINTLEELILQGRIRFHVNPALRSAVAGATFIESPAGLRRFAKEKATTRIDLLIALTMAVGASCVGKDGGGISVYELLAKQRAERGEQSESRELTEHERFARGLDVDDDDDDL